MSYQSLARKYRPRRFQDMVGQDAITKALTNAIRLKRIPQGVIFSGVRGIGKTTTARLYAKALNCSRGPTPEPCNDCDSCLAINEGIHEDVLEIDGASNTSVDDIRALQETLDYVPQRSPYKVYIIDEVHMLSQSAFNALLKTLEEPPEHVVFSFATTELQKVPETILSRCQTFHLKRLGLAAIVDRLKTIVESEGIDFETHALVAIAKEGRGSMRDSLTFLDQVIALGDGCVAEASLKGLINAASSKSYFLLLEALVARNASQVVAVIQEWDEKGVPLDEAIEEVAKFCRHGFVLKELGKEGIDTTLLGLAPTELQFLEDIAKQAPILDLNRIFRTLVTCRKDLDGSELDRYLVENYCLEWCLDPGLPNLEDMQQASITGTPSKGKLGHGGPHPKAKPSSSVGGNLKERWNSAFSVGQAEPKPNKPAEVLQDPVPAERQPASRQPTLVSPQKPKEEPPQQTPAVEDSKVSHQLNMPDSWKELVGLWKSKKPLQGRILEETVPVSYSLQEIRVSVDPSSMAGAKLLSADHKKRVLDGLRQLFGFSGLLTVDVLSPEALVHESHSDSLLQARQKQQVKDRDDLFEEIRSHPITKEALTVFDGTINDINMVDQ